MKIWQNDSLFLFLIRLVGLCFAPALVFAEDLPKSDLPEVKSEIETSQEVQPAKPAQLVKPKGRIVREKEAEGTKAPNRFDTDIIIKSRYEYNGQSLEVDTD
jgi:hypothetical protein